MDDSPEVIRLQMEETRASLSEKLGSLEQQVVDTVHEAKAAVTDTVTSVKDAVHDTVESVKDTFDIGRQVRTHPWAMLGGSVALGFLGGVLFNRFEQPHPYPHQGTWTPPPAPETHGGYPAQHFASAPAPAKEEHSLLHQFEPEIAKLKGLAVGAALGMVRDIVSGSIPEPLKPQVMDVINNLTVKLGGQPIKGELIKAA